MTRQQTSNSAFWSFVLTVAAVFVLLFFALCTPAHSQTGNPYVTLTGTIQAANGLPAANYGLTFQPTQQSTLAGTGIVISSTTNCSTSTDGTVVGLSNPVGRPVVTAQYTGTLPAGNYYVVIDWMDAAGGRTLPSPEVVVQLTSAGALQVAPPASGVPAGAVLMEVYVGTTSGSELQAGYQSVSTLPYILSATQGPGGSAPKTTNSTACKQYANDAMWPVGGYTVSLIDPNGNAAPGYPMTWQLLGPGTTVSLGSGLPTWRGVVLFPAPILSQPSFHVAQSISGPLGLNGYNLFGVGKLGVGTANPAYPLDIVGVGNASGGWLVGGVAPLNTILLGDGTSFKPSTTIPPSLLPSAGTPAYATTAGTANQLAATTQCGGGQYSTGISPNGTSQCGTLPTAPAAAIVSASITGTCTTGSSSYSACTSLVTWPAAIAAAYRVNCSGVGPSDPRAVLNVASKNSTGVTVQVQTMGSVSVSFSEVDCVATTN